MNEKKSFWRKVRYFSAIAVLLVPLSMLGLPASGTQRVQESSGGQLSKLRDSYKLSQATLGEVDPASETMKLMTLGLRNVAAIVLWEKANHAKKTEDWTGFRAALDQIQRVQPNFITVWIYQAWNTSYNVSVEFDDYHDRYHWVIQGINSLLEGEKFNEDDPRLLWETGWYISNKIGRADEQVQYRKLFRADDDFHREAGRVGEQRDNWLVGKEWFLKAINAIDHKGKSLGNKSPQIFYSHAAMAQINYSEALEKDGVFGEVAPQAWKKADDEWREFGAVSFRSSQGFEISLDSMERREEEATKHAEKLDKIAQNIRSKLHDERFAKLSQEERDSVQLPATDRTPEQSTLADAATMKLQITHQDVADEVRKLNPEAAEEAERLARLAMEQQEIARIIGVYRQTVNYEYWKSRCELEQTADALAAREFLFRGDEAVKKRADVKVARDLYEKGMARWRLVYDRFPQMVEEGSLGDDLIDTIVRYRRILEEDSADGDKSLPDDFPLWDIVENNDREGKLEDVLQIKRARDAEKQRGKKPSTEEPNDAKPDEAPEGKPEENAEAKLNEAPKTEN